MARMIPSPMADDVDSEAERLLYRKFEEELSNEFTVIHQARWIGRRDGLEGQDGEADFILLHPTKGIVVLEAKSGEVRLGGGAWYERRGRTESRIKDPVKQACDSKHFLLDRYLADHHLGARSLHVVHAIALPHVAVPDKGLGPDATRERILDARDLQTLTSWVTRALASAELRVVGKPALGADGVARIVDDVAVKRDLKTWTPGVASAVQEKLARLTNEQFQTLSSLRSIPRAYVTGGPGSGKTLLAIEAARRFGRQGKRTLLVCFNAPLGGYLRSVVENLENVEATHFHELCRRMALEAGLTEALHAAEQARDYEHGFADLLLQATEVLGAPFDAIVVDEAQDFRETWWIALEACLKGDGKGTLYLFEDEAQQFDEREHGARPDDLVGPFHLTKNCRNPDEIHAFLTTCPGASATLLPSGVTSGILPRVTWVEKEGQFPRHVSAVVARLIKDWSVPPSEIVVLTPRAAPRSALGKAERLGPAKCAWRERPDDQHVLIDTVHRFKGLEATAIVLAELSPLVRPDLATHLQVGSSRPTIHLDLVASPAISGILRNALDFGLLEES